MAWAHCSHCLDGPEWQISSTLKKEAIQAWSVWLVQSPSAPPAPPLAAPSHATAKVSLWWTSAHSLSVLSSTLVDEYPNEHSCRTQKQIYKGELPSPCLAMRNPPSPPPAANQLIGRETNWLWGESQATAKTVSTRVIAQRPKCPHTASNVIMSLWVQARSGVIALLIKSLRHTLFHC